MSELISKSAVCQKNSQIRPLICVWITLLLVAWEMLFIPTTHAAQEPAAAKLVEVANKRLQEELDGLKSDKTKLETDLNRTENERQDLLNKLKIITEENTKLKDQVATLQQGLINLDNAKKQLLEEKKQLEQKSAVPQKQTLSAASEGKTGKLSAQRISALEKEVASLTNRNRQLSRQLDTQMSKARFTDKLHKEKKRLQEEVKGLRLAINSLEGQAKKHTQENTILKSKLKNVAAKFFKSQKSLDRLEKETADMHYNLGVIFQGQNKYNEAIREYEKTLEIRPNDPDTHYNLALIYDTVKNDRKKAIYYYNKYLGSTLDTQGALKIKEKVAQLNSEEKIWGAPYAKELREKKGDL